MAKPKGPTYQQASDSFNRVPGAREVEAIEYTFMGPFPKENGHTEIIIRCPFCATHVTVRTWSLAGGGKRCLCGALFGNYHGARAPRMAYHWAERES